MLARAQVSVVALAALVACAACRPDFFNRKTSFTTKKYRSANDPSVNAVEILQDTTPANLNNYTPSTNFQDVTITNELKTISAADPTTSVKEGAAEVNNKICVSFNKDSTLFNLNPSSDAALEPESSSEPPPIPSLFRNDSAPVNLRYPHAVLFGGTCGGSIIHPKWILTAGHCTLFTGGRYVLAGTNNSDDGSGITKKVKKLYIHPKFSVGPYWLNAEKYGIEQVAARWDFMLAELEEALELDGVKLAAVPLEEQKKLAPGTYVGYAGYGTDHHGGFMRSEMHAMHLQTQNNKTCQILEQFNSKDMICAKGYAPNFDSACNGDSGSGLVSGSGKLVGVASWVQKDALECRNGNIVVFSKVASVRNWIRLVAGV